MLPSEEHLQAAELADNGPIAVTRGRRVMKRLAYLAQRAPAEERRRS
jgi:hypothetical protein